MKFPKLDLSIKVLHSETPSHEDTVFFVFLNLRDIIKTYCYIAQSQIDFISRIDTPTNEEYTGPTRSSWKNKELAQKEKFFFNTALLSLFKDCNPSHDLSRAKDRFQHYKKNSVISVLFDDRPFLFHKTSNSHFSHIDLDQFTFSRFLFNKKTTNNELLKKNSISFNAKDISSLKELCLFVFGEISAPIKKEILNICVVRDGKESLNFDYELIRLIKFMRNFLSSEDVLDMVKNHKKELKKHVLNHYLYTHSLSCPETKGLITFFSGIKSSVRRKNIFIKFNIQSHVVKLFAKTMVEAYPKLKPDLDRVEDPKLFYFYLSQDYGRLSLPNTPTKIRKELSHLKDMDGITVGDFNMKIPENYHEMIKWGQQLHNCAGNYDQQEHYQEGLPVGILKDNKIVYLLDVQLDYSNKVSVNQFKGFKDSLPSKEELALFLPIFESFNMTMKEQKQRDSE